MTLDFGCRTKKALKALVGQPACTALVETSMFAPECYPYSLTYRFPAMLVNHPDHVMYFVNQEDLAEFADNVRGVGGRVTSDEHSQVTR